MVDISSSCSILPPTPSARLPNTMRRLRQCDTMSLIKNHYLLTYNIAHILSTEYSTPEIEKNILAICLLIQ